MYQNLDLKRPASFLAEPIENYNAIDDDDNVFCYSQDCRDWVYGSVHYDESNEEFYCTSKNLRMRGVTHFMRSPLLMLI